MGLHDKLFFWGMTLFSIGALVCLSGWVLLGIAGHQRRSVLRLQREANAIDVPAGEYRDGSPSILRKNKAIRELNNAVDKYGFGTRWEEWPKKKESTDAQ